MSLPVEILTFSLGPLETNCHVVADRNSGKAVVIDPAADGEWIADQIVSRNWHLDKILLTHGHADHIAGLNALRSKTGVEVAIHMGDRDMLARPEKNLSLFIGMPIKSEPPEILLSQDEVIQLGHSKIQVIHTPGHTPGSVCFLIKDVLISGDTIFRNSIGRADFPGASFEQLMDSIQTQIMVLDNSIRILPGHGMESTIGHERAHNPFIQTSV